MNDTEGSQCSVCRWTRNEMAKIRAKLEKAETLITEFESDVKHAYAKGVNMDETYWYDQIKDYREQKGPNE